MSMLGYCNPWFIISFLAVMGISILVGTQEPSVRAVLTQKSLLASYIGVAVFYQISRWIELKIPKVTPIALKLAPVTFLTFAGHAILFSYCVPEILKHNVVFVFLCPLIAFTIMSLMFFAMKRWSRPLLHLVAHYKLRPDDFSN